MDKNRNVNNSDQSGLHISFMEMWLALKKGYSIVLLASFLGLMIQGIRYYSSEKVFEAKAFLQLGRIYGPQNQNKSSLDPTVGSTNYLDSASLIALLHNPTTYPEGVQDNCSSASNRYSSQKIATSLIVNKYMGVNTLLELKVFGPSPAIALSCTMSIIERIKLFESAHIKPTYRNLNQQLKTLDTRITDIQRMITTSNNKGEGSVVASSLLMNDLYRLQVQKDAIVNSFSEGPFDSSFLVGEVYSTGDPMSKNLKILLFEGLVAGALIGLIAIFMNLAIRKIKV